MQIRPIYLRNKAGEERGDKKPERQLKSSLQKNGLVCDGDPFFLNALESEGMGISPYHNPNWNPAKEGYSHFFKTFFSFCGSAFYVFYYHFLPNARATISLSDGALFTELSKRNISVWEACGGLSRCFLVSFPDSILNDEDFSCCFVKNPNPGVFFEFVKKTPLSTIDVGDGFFAELGSLRYESFSSGHFLFCDPGFTLTMAVLFRECDGFWPFLFPLGLGARAAMKEAGYLLWNEGR